jgi:hypothetical protein
MAETASTAEDRALDALTKILESAISPDMLDAQKIILRRLALAGDLFPSRVPPPLNISEVGGYLNLLVEEPVLRAQVLAAALGVAGPNPPLGWEAALPAVYLAARANDRPAGTSQPTIPLQFFVRSDFASALDAALTAIHDRGCTLPILSASRPLPPATPGATPPDDLLPYIGRVLELVPATALNDPATDPIGVGEPGGGGPLQVLTRQLDTSAPNASDVGSAAWDLWSCTTSACTQASFTGAYLPLAPLLNAAGWYQPTLTAPTTLTDAGGWNRWTNVAGLVGNMTRFGDELALLHSPGAIAQSSVRERLEWVWDGSTFVAPT